MKTKAKEGGSEHELATLFPEPVRIETREGPIEVKPITVAQIGRASRHLRAFLTSGGNDLDMTKLLEDADNAIAFVAVAVGWPEDLVGKLLPDDFMRLIQTVIEVNKDFFVKSVAPLVSDALATMSLVPLAGGTGPTQLNS